MNIVTAQNIIYRESLTLKAQAVFIYLADRSNKKNICWPGLKRIATDCRVSVSTVQRAIKELLQIGLLIKKPNYRENGSQTSNIYIVNENLEEKEAVKKENNRIQRKIEARKKKQARKEKIVERVKDALEKVEQKEAITNKQSVILKENVKKQLLNTNVIKTSEHIKNILHKAKVNIKNKIDLNPLNFNFLTWGVVRKNSQEPKHINHTYRKRKIE